MGLTLVKIASKLTGDVIEGADLTPRIADYAMRNREIFNLFYQGDVLLPAEVEPSSKVDIAPVFSAVALNAKTKLELIDLLATKNIEATDASNKSDLIAMLMEAQEKGI